MEFHKIDTSQVYNPLVEIPSLQFIFEPTDNTHLRFFILTLIQTLYPGSNSYTQIMSENPDKPINNRLCVSAEDGTPICDFELAQTSDTTIVNFKNRLEMLCLTRNFPREVPIKVIRIGQIELHITTELSSDAAKQIMARFFDMEMIYTAIRVKALQMRSKALQQSREVVQNLNLLVFVAKADGFDISPLLHTLNPELLRKINSNPETYGRSEQGVSIKLSKNINFVTSSGKNIEFTLTMKSQVTAGVNPQKPELLFSRFKNVTIVIRPKKINGLYPTPQEMNDIAFWVTTMEKNYFDELI